MDIRLIIPFFRDKFRVNSRSGPVSTRQGVIAEGLREWSRFLLRHGPADAASLPSGSVKVTMRVAARGASQGMPVSMDTTMVSETALSADVRTLAARAIRLARGAVEAIPQETATRAYGGGLLGEAETGTTMGLSGRLHVALHFAEGVGQVRQKMFGRIAMSGSAAQGADPRPARRCEDHGQSLRRRRPPGYPVGGSLIGKGQNQGFHVTRLLFENTQVL